MTPLIDADQLVRNNQTIRQSRIEGRVWLLAVAIMQFFAGIAGLLRWVSPVLAVSTMLAVSPGWIFAIMAVQRSRRLEAVLREQILIRNARLR